MKKAVYVHLMFNDKFNAGVVAMLNRFYPEAEHVILCKRYFQGGCFRFPSGKNVFEVRHYYSCLKRSSVRQRLICHSLFDNELVDILYKNPPLLERTSWIIWGGDLYSAKRDAANDFVRKNISRYAVLAPGDWGCLKRKYPITRSDDYVYLHYGVLDCGFPLSVNAIPYNVGRRATKRIQINNSCDRSTLDILKALSALSWHDDVEIVTIVSYGDLSCRDEIVSLGNALFGSKFAALDKLLTPDEYYAHLQTLDVYIAAQNRQQGTGNIYYCLACGAKVYIRSEVSTYANLKQFGYDVYDTNAIAGVPYEQFFEHDSQKNRDLCVKDYCDAHLKQMWDALFSGG